MVWLGAGIGLVCQFGGYEGEAVGGQLVGDGPTGEEDFSSGVGCAQGLGVPLRDLVEGFGESSQVGGRGYRVDVGSGVGDLGEEVSGA